MDAGAESHSRQVVVWDTPPVVECGQAFTLKAGVKCGSECPPSGWRLEIRDDLGNRLAATTLSEEPWTGTAALYYAEVALTAPATAGVHSWVAIVPASGHEGSAETPHEEARVSFNVRSARAPECRLRITAIDQETRAPVRGAKVVAHPYRSLTDEAGVAELQLPKGEYRIFVSGRDYCPFRHDAVVDEDTTIEAELYLDLGPTDAELWS